MHNRHAGSLTGTNLRCTVIVMKLSISADIELDGQPSHVTWMDVRIQSSAKETCGVARVALVHVGEIADAHGDLYPALAGTSLEPLCKAYFDEGWYKEEFADGAGIDLLYVESIEMDAGHENKNLDLAMVRRLCDTVGSGCQLAVMPYKSAMVAGHWSRLGFALTTPGRSNGLMHMKLGYRHAQVIDPNGTGEFVVLPTSSLDAPKLDRHMEN